MSKQLENLPASGLTLELKNHFKGIAFALSIVYIIFCLLLVIALLILATPFTLDKWPFGFLFVVIFWYCLTLFKKNFLMIHPDSIIKLVFTELGWCHVQFKNLCITKANVQADTVLTEHLVILNLKGHSEQKKWPFISNGYSIFVTADRIGHDKFREFRRYLRFISFIEKEEKNNE
ncbi:MAG: hypothetical protein GY694_07240 [Gammaproteobacteria bacterium]|nr:hypothetical protein [Gammaproteobacteria bacterium]